MIHKTPCQKLSKNYLRTIHAKRVLLFWKLRDNEKSRFLPFSETGVRNLTLIFFSPNLIPACLFLLLCSLA